MSGFKIIVRKSGEQVLRETVPTLDAAITTLEETLSSYDTLREPVAWLGRAIPPEEQVVVRGEISGAGVAGGIDLRGDGSAEAFVGKWRRTSITAGKKESAYDALRRELAAS